MTEDFLESVLPRLTEADTALHNGDAAPRIAIWSHDDPVTLFGAALMGNGWTEIREVFESLASRFSNGTFEYEIIASGASGDLGYVVGIEHSTASVGGAPPEASDLRVTQVFRREDGEWKVVHRLPTRCQIVTPPVANWRGSSRHNDTPGVRGFEAQHPCGPITSIRSLREPRRGSPRAASR